MLLLGLLSHGEAVRPQIRAGYDCTQPCEGASKHSKRACEFRDFRWDLLDSLDHNKGLRAYGNGSILWDRTNAVSGYSCNPALSKNQSLFMQHAREQNVKNVIGLHGPKTRNPSFNSTSDVYNLLANETTRHNAAASACAIACKAGFDGVSVDFEGPWTSNIAFRHVFADFMREIALACHGQTPKPLTVSAALSHDLSYSVGQNGAAISNAATDGIVLMTYDYLYTGNGSGPTRPNAPLYADTYMGFPTPNNNVNSSIWYALQLKPVAVPASQLTMGIAWYGKEVPAVGLSLGAAMNISTSSAAADVDQKTHNYQQPLMEKRAATFGEGGRKWDGASMTPWYSYQDAKRPWLYWQGFYDDAESLKYKYDLVKSLGLRGVLVWSINACTVEAAPSMWSTLEDAFGSKSILVT